MNPHHCDSTSFDGVESESKYPGAQRLGFRDPQLAAPPVRVKKALMVANSGLGHNNWALEYHTLILFS